MKQHIAEIVVIGNELLNGTTLDTNSHWLSKRLTKLGILISRKTTVRDELRDVSRSFSEALGRKPHWIFALGGLGPTYDDITLKGLANALKRKIVRDPNAEKMLKEYYVRRGIYSEAGKIRIPRASLKMAEIPEGSISLRNSAGAAPGVLVSLGSMTTVSLPGVRREMKSIFAEEVEPLIRREDHAIFRTAEIWFRVEGVGESRLASRIKKIASKYSKWVYIKSHPISFRASRSVLQIQLTSMFSEDQLLSATKALKKAADLVKQAITKAGGDIRTIKET